MGSEPDEAHIEAELILLPLCNGLNAYKVITIEPALVIFHWYHKAVVHRLFHTLSLVTSPPSGCAFLSETCASHRGPLTFNGGVEVGVFVQHFHLLAPVKLIPPVGHHLPQVGGVEAVVEGGSFHVRCEAEPIQALVQILWKGALLARLASCWPVACVLCQGRHRQAVLALLAFVLLSDTTSPPEEVPYST